MRVYYNSRDLNIAAKVKGYNEPANKSSVLLLGRDIMRWLVYITNVENGGGSAEV